ncbi:MAG: hypothetical protein R3B09_16240 [Nannocystaceae bacterium]
MERAEDDAIDRGFSEFGAAFAAYLERHRSCRGVVLTDDDGFPIDYARRCAGISALDVQILGATVERALAPLREVVRVRGLGPPTLCAVAERGVLLTSPLAVDTTLAAIHGAGVDDGALAALTADFEALAERVLGLLRA